MRALIKYISLLLYSGLIIPFYYYHLPCNSLRSGKQPYPAIHKYKTVKKAAKKRFSLVNETVAEILPVLKNLH